MRQRRLSRSRRGLAREVRLFLPPRTSHGVSVNFRSMDSNDGIARRVLRIHPEKAVGSFICRYDLYIQRTLKAFKHNKYYSIIFRASSSVHFENVAFFHAKLGLDACPRVDHETSGDLTRPLVEKLPSASYPPTGIGASFWRWDALLHQPVGIREETLESGNLFIGG